MRCATCWRRSVRRRAVRDAWTNTDGRSGAWDALTEMGVTGITHPEAAGAMGVDEIAIALILEETGRVALPEPIVEHTAVALPVVAELRPDAVTEATLLAAGGPTVAVRELRHRAGARARAPALPRRSRRRDADPAPVGRRVAEDVLGGVDAIGGRRHRRTR